MKIGGECGAEEHVAEVHDGRRDDGGDRTRHRCRHERQAMNCPAPAKAAPSQARPGGGRSPPCGDDAEGHADRDVAQEDGEPERRPRLKRARTVGTVLA